MLKPGKRKELNLLELVPERAAEFSVDGDGRVSITIPRFRSTFLRQWLTPRGRQPHLHTKLDAFGSCVWQHCDGSRTVAEIADVLLDTFGEDIQPVHERLGLFINQLRRYQYIRLQQSDGTPV